MKTRIFAGAGLCAVLIITVLLNGVFPLFLNILIAFMCAVGAHELCKCFSMDKQKWVYVPSILFAAVSPFVGFASWGLFLLACIYTLWIFFTVIHHHEIIKFTEMIPVYAMNLLVTVALNTIISIRNISTEFGIFYAMVAILGPWVADAGAYFSGSFFGKHKLCPKISPKKTVEGFVGGIIVSIVAMLLGGILFTKLYSPENAGIHYIVLAVSGFLCGFVSVVGDLSFSIIKREKGIKDYGKLIPGHGGILDRFDSVIFVSPFVYMLLCIFGVH